MRIENIKMKNFLAQQGIKATPRFINKGSMFGCWRLYNLQMKWSSELVEKLNGLGFIDSDHKALGKYSGNGGWFSIFTRNKKLTDLFVNGKKEFTLENTWCLCETDKSANSIFQDDNECRCGVNKHHYHCYDCGGIIQRG